jgi:hypothetical protein
MRTPYRRWVLIGVAVGALLLSGCASKKSATGTGSVGTIGATPTANPSPTTTAGDTPTVTATTTATTTPTATSSSTAPPNAPRIKTFRITQKPACAVIGTTDAPFSTPGVDITLEWDVSNVDTVALSIDDPKWFDTYHTGNYSDFAPKGAVQLSFPCDPKVQPNTTHTYTINTIGGGASISRTLTVTVQTSP